MKLKELIKEKGYTQESLGRALGVKQTAVSNWCNGENGMSAQRLNQVATLLGVSMNDVLNAINAKEEKSLEDV